MQHVANGPLAPQYPFWVIWWCTLYKHRLLWGPQHEAVVFMCVNTKDPAHPVYGVVHRTGPAPAKTKREKARRTSAGVSGKPLGHANDEFIIRSTLKDLQHELSVKFHRRYVRLTTLTISGNVPPHDFLLHLPPVEWVTPVNESGAGHEPRMPTIAHIAVIVAAISQTYDKYDLRGSEDGQNCYGLAYAFLTILNSLFHPAVQLTPDHINGKPKDPKGSRIPLVTAHEWLSFYTTTTPNAARVATHFDALMNDSVSLFV